MRPNLVGYTTPKAGLPGLTRTLARVPDGRKIRVSAVVPGTIVTDQESGLHRAAGQAFVDARCLRIRLNPGHVARVALFMASHDSDGMMGQHVLIDACIAQCSVMS